MAKTNKNSSNLPKNLPETLLKSVGLGVAVANPENGEIIFENAKFFEWFPPVEGEGDDINNLFTRIAEHGENVKTTLENAKKASFEKEIKVGPRTVNLLSEVKKECWDDQNWLVLETQNISKQKQAEYMLDSYSRMSEKHARDLQKEKDRVEKLLLNIMPKSVYDELKDFGTTTPQKFDCATVLVLDFVGFTKMAISHDPGATISELNDIFSAFDRIVELFGCERIKTIGDSYICVSGMPEAATDHAHNIAKVAVRMRRYLEKRNASHPQNWSCRIGISSGPVIGSMVGIQKYVYDIFGPAVNLAARLENLAQPNEILIDEKTKGLIAESFDCESGGKHELKGFGQVQVYSVGFENI